MLTLPRQIYEERKQELIDQALAGIQDLPIPKIEKPMMKEAESSKIKQILSAFQQKLQTSFTFS